MTRMKSEIQSDWVQHCPTHMELLRARALRHPERRAYTFLADKELEETHLTFAMLDEKARAIAALLQDYRASGLPVLLLYPAGLEYLTAFFGCLYAGAIAVPAYPPRLNHNLERLEAIVADAQPALILSSQSLLTAALRERFMTLPQLGKLPIENTDSLAKGLADQWREPTVSGETLAFLQYTSGSTGKPKGVMVSHQNLLYNHRQLQAALQHPEEAPFVSWLPLFHDMGLIGKALQSVYCGAPCIFMSPFAFIQKPFRWLQTISSYKAYSSYAPNFAYDLCVQKITPEQRTTLDLSHWHNALNAAEPIRAETLERFTKTFADCGFRREAFRTAYGLAEATLAVSVSSPGQAAIVRKVRRDALEQNRVIPALNAEEQSVCFVSSGHAWLEQKIRIVDPQTHLERSPGQIGEIWLASRSNAQGYWQRPEASRETFQARLADTGEGPFMRTGDLGFLEDDELFVTGRLKDLIIVHGQNYYPQDIELVAEKSHPALRQNCNAAFSLDSTGEEQVFLVQEIERQHRHQDPKEVFAAIRQAVAEECGLHLQGIVLIKPGSIPKTSSGKIQRRACREALLANTLSVVFEDIPKPVADLPEQSTAKRAEVPVEQLVQTFRMQPHNKRQALLEDYLWRQISQVLQQDVEDLRDTTEIRGLGLDSLKAMSILNCCQQDLQVELPLSSFFESPTISALAEQLTQLLDQAVFKHPVPLVPVSRDQPLPLSFVQQRLWFFDQLMPNSHIYNITRFLRLQGEIVVPALKYSVEEIVRRHEALRTTFPSVNGQPVQAISPFPNLLWSEVDFQDYANEIREEQALAFVREEARRPMDLARGPLMRVFLLKLNHEDHMLVMTFHHIIFDAWSGGLFVSELMALYRAFSSGQPSPLPELPLQCADFAVWQRQWQHGEARENQLAYWRQQLYGPLPILNLPTDYPRPAIQTYRGARAHFRLSACLTENLKALSRQEDATLFMLLLGAFQILCARHSGQEDLLIGVPVANRGRVEVERLIGCFVNPLAIRADLSQNPPFREFLRQVRETMFAAYTHQDLPFEQIVEAFQSERDLSRHPIFQVMFVSQDVPLSTTEIANLRLSALDIDNGVAECDMTFIILEAQEHITGLVEYNVDLFTENTIQRFLQQYQTLLEGIVHTPDARLSALPLLDKPARYDLVVRRNQTQQDFPLPSHYIQFLAEQVARTPERIAVSDAESLLTYAELWRRVQRLAGVLQQQGVGTETLVGLYMERSISLLVSVLATWCCAAAYVPLDPTYPAERLRLIVERTRLPLLLTTTALRESLSTSQARVLCLDQLEAEQQGDEMLPKRIPLLPEYLAYVIFTSGSTGIPKGVMVNHAGMLNHLWAKVTAVELTENDVVAQTASHCSVNSVWQLLVALLKGGHVQILPDDISHDPALLAQVIQQGAISVLQIVPSLLAILLDEPDFAPGKPVGLRWLSVTGEAMPKELCRRWWREHAGIGLLNAYGSTECSDDVSHAVLTEAAEQQQWRVPIGNVLANTQIYVLDKYLEPVPQGVVGDIYIGGKGVGRGYLEDPGRTAEVFVPDPFGKQAGSRLYRMGDRGRYRIDGQLEFIERRDGQVKSRGHRIELGEIEAVLDAHEQVKQSMVVMQETGQMKRLVAFVVGESGKSSTEGDVAELRSYLKGRLPDYMMPAHFVLLEAFPLTPMGKVDRKALSTYKVEQLENAGAAFVAARTPLEEQLSLIWRETLHIERIGIYDNFFDLGGHSLLATRVSAQVREMFQIELPLRTFFELPTIADLAPVIVQRQIEQVDNKELALAMAELELFSEQEVQMILAGKPQDTRKEDSHG